MAAALDRFHCTCVKVAKVKHFCTKLNHILHSFEFVYTSLIMLQWKLSWSPGNVKCGMEFHIFQEVCLY